MKKFLNVALHLILLGISDEDDDDKISCRGNCRWIIARDVGAEFCR
jgi:hypothetical protein